MTDDSRSPSLSRKAGRGLLRALSGLFGKKNVRKARDSLDVLKDEFRAGKQEAEGEPKPPPKPIPHKDLESDPTDN